MIQRKQTLFFILALLFIGLVFNWPFATAENSEHPYLADQSFDLYDHSALYIATSIALIALLFAIGTYKNRALQIKLSYVPLILCLFVPALAWIFFYGEVSDPQIAEEISLHWGQFLFIPAIIFIYLGIRGIQSDIQLLRSSSNRLR
jgi:membrane protease YdiL (CAAX protease family)